MSATDILSHEHRAIEIVLYAMEKAAARLESGEEVDRSFVEDCLDFAMGFADKCHHAKEEEVLFPLLQERGIPRDGGPIGVMLHEHDEGRHFIKCINKHLDAWTAGDYSARTPLAQELNGYANLLRSHIAKEDQALFVMASGVLSDEDNERLIKAFDEIEERKIGPGVHERYHQMLDDLKERADKL
ncbi:MAG: hemerythrin domain-containing protein [Armatimonadetes bacterium]|nr:hemerythrin domain-containing protein [Armatimonadota bacterium]